MPRGFGIANVYYYRLDPSITMFRCLRCTRVLPWIDFSHPRIRVLDNDKAEEEYEENLECPYCHSRGNQIEEV